MHGTARFLSPTLMRIFSHAAADAVRHVKAAALAGLASAALVWTPATAALAAAPPSGLNAAIIVRCDNGLEQVR